MTIIRVQVNIPRDSSLPEDDTINTWHFLTVGAATVAAAAGDAVTQLSAFYGVIDGSMAGYNNTPIRFKVYDLADVPPRVPHLEATSAATYSVSTNFPAEVSIALSYRGELLSGTNPARRRGRIFLGPWGTAVSQGSTSDVTVTSATRALIAGAAKSIIQAGATDDARWVVFSPTLAGPGPWDSAQLEAASCDVTAGFVDDAFDTVRSRGAKAVNRTIFSAILP